MGRLTFSTSCGHLIATAAPKTALQRHIGPVHYNTDLCLFLCVCACACVCVGISVWHMGNLTTTATLIRSL